MKVKEITLCAMLCMIMYGSYILLSGVLYLEAVTFTTILIAVLFPLKLSLTAAFCFGLINILLQGIFPWSIMYLIIFPLYVLVAYRLRESIITSELVQVVICFLFSFLIGQFADLPYILFSGKITIVYMLIGLKTSLIQGFLSALLANFLFKKAYDRIYKYLKGVGLYEK